MSDIKLFRTDSASVTELRGSAVALEKSLQTLIERNMEAFLGVRFLASEFPTTNGGRMDSLGIDENGSPVIVEYKRASNENVINQGLFYLDWLMDHRRDFEWLVLERFGAEEAKAVDWTTPRLICIAGDFTKYEPRRVYRRPFGLSYAAMAGASRMAWYRSSASAGGIFPMGSKRRLLLNQSTHSSVANSSASKLRHGRRRWMTSAF